MNEKNLQKNLQKNPLLPPILQIPLVTENLLPLLLPTPPTQRLNLAKYQIAFIFKTFLTFCHFTWYILSPYFLRYI